MSSVEKAKLKKYQGILNDLFNDENGNTHDYVRSLIRTLYDAKMQHESTGDQIPPSQTDSILSVISALTKLGDMKEWEERTPITNQVAQQA